MSKLNVILGSVAALCWIGPVTWYFWDEIRTSWLRRHDRFRQD